MGNWTVGPGVYSNMRRMSLMFLCLLAAPAQPLSPPDPLDAAIQAFWQTAVNVRPQEAAAQREHARVLLQSASADSPSFGSWAAQVAQMYQNVGLNAQSRAILEEALGRTAPAGYSYQSRLFILSALANSWEQDGNLLKALGYLEQLAVGQAAAPVIVPAQTGMHAGGIVRITAWGGGGPFGSAINSYIHLAALYHRLGRPESVAATEEKIRALVSNDPVPLARFYEQNERFQEAAEIYAKLADQASDPLAKANAWQSLAGVSARQEHFPDAIAAMQQAIDAIQSSPRPGVASQALWMRQMLAGYMRQAGLIDQGDQVYQELLQQTRGGPQEIQFITGYAGYLAESERAPQGEAFLKEYLASHPALDAQERMNIYFNLSNVAQRANDSISAEQYRLSAQALQVQPEPAGSISIAGELKAARSAMDQERWEDAYGSALHAIDAAAGAADGQQVDWSIPQIASRLAAHQPAKADQLFQRLSTLVQNGAANSTQRLIVIRQQYANFLMGQNDRWSEVPVAIEQFRRVLTDANGPESGTLVGPLEMSLQFLITQSRWQQVDAAVRALLEFQQSLSGYTSDAYLRNLETAAYAYQAARDLASALPLRRRAIVIADLLATPSNGWARSQTRMAAAMTLAAMGQFDEAEAVGAEAVTLAAVQRTPNPPLVQQLEQIHRMKRAALPVPPAVPVKP